MPSFDQQKTTYTDVTPQMQVISDVINIIDPRDTPFIAAIGGLDGARGKFKIKENGYKIEILEDELDSMTGVVANGTVDLTTTTLSFTVADASDFQKGHVILIGAEYLVVSAVNVTNNLVTVGARNYGGTNSTHATNAAIEIVGMARLEGADADYCPIMDVTAPFNYTSIYQKGLNISGTQQVISQHGITDEYEYQSLKAIPALLRLIEKSCFHGIRQAGSASLPRSMGGLFQFITDNTQAAGGAITKAFVDNVMEFVYLDGGNPDMLVLNPSVARDVKDLIDTSSFVRLAYENSQVGMQPVQRFSTQYGSLQLVMSRFCPVDRAFIVDSKKVGLYSLRPFAWHEVGVVGDSKRGEVIGEFSLMVANDKGHGRITGITS